MPGKRVTKRYRAICRDCGQASLSQGRTGAAKWAKGHRALAEHRVSVVSVLKCRGLNHA